VLPTVSHENAAHRLNLLNEIAAFHFTPVPTQLHAGRREFGRWSDQHAGREDVL
jgi:hypothetical protein